MPSPVFISYSRSEAPFVDAFLDALEDRNVQVWADYRSLVPARPWWEQILEGINSSDAFLLVVSKESMASKTVEQEYNQALGRNKRIILIIFEAVPLPPALQSREWIDFRGPFGRRLKRLLRQLNLPAEQPAPPQKGFKTSFVVWLTSCVSLFTALISVPAWWTIYIPLLLVPLPFRILHRDFHFYRVRFAVLTLPLVLLLSWVFSLGYPQTQAVTLFCLLASLVTSPILLLLLSSKGMRRWGKPMASVPRFPNPFHPKVKQPEPVAFYIEHAPEDKYYADAIAKGLKKHGHSQVMTPQEAQADFVLISRYKTSTLINAERRVVYPIMIQDAQVPDSLIRRIQWIDFRRGIRHLDSLGKLLPEPAKLLRALGVAPLSEQMLYPRIIRILDYYLILLGFFSVSAWLPLMIEPGPQFLQSEGARIFLAVNVVLSGLILLIFFFARRALMTRAGRLASLGGLNWSILWIGLLGFAQCFYIINNIFQVTTLAGAVSVVAQQDLRGSAILFFPIAYILGLILTGFFSIWNWGDLTRWFPYREKRRT